MESGGIAPRIHNLEPTCMRVVLGRLTPVKESQQMESDLVVGKNLINNQARTYLELVRKSVNWSSDYSSRGYLQSLFIRRKKLKQGDKAKWDIRVSRNRRRQMPEDFTKKWVERNTLRKCLLLFASKSLITWYAFLRTRGKEKQKKLRLVLIRDAVSYFEVRTQIRNIGK